jgi:hypothetical protein
MEYLWLPIANKLTYPEADQASSRLRGSCIAPYRKPIAQPNPVVRIDDKTNCPVGLDGTMLASSLLQRACWSVYYSFPTRITQPDFVVYARKYLFRFVGRRELIIVFENSSIIKQMLYSTKTAVIQSDVDLYFDETELQIVRAKLFSGQPSLEWWV